VELILNPEIEAEVAALAARYGEPRRVAAVLSGTPFDPLIMTDRFGEVCMVIRRPGGALLTAIKTFYPPGAYRLLTGGVGHGEPIEAALLREVEEETGLDVEVQRFVAVIEYHLEPSVVRSPLSVVDQGASPLSDNRQSITDNEQITQHATRNTQHNYTFVTFVFLLDEVGGTLGPRDPEERIASFREVQTAELPMLAATLDGIGQGFDPRIGGSWSDWGRFRAVVHRVVHEALAG
jgi:8-oxo-dGTP pyrophosphatase MutT (NUDIX family)